MLKLSGEALMGSQPFGIDPKVVKTIAEELAAVVELGVQVAVVVGGGATFEAAPPAEVEVVDTVGAGDAFSAVFILGLVAGWSTELILERAAEFAAAVCTVPGATTADRRLYARFQHLGWW